MRPRGMPSRWVKVLPWYYTERRQSARAAERSRLVLAELEDGPLPAGHVIYCRGCQRAWIEGAAPSMLDLIHVSPGELAAADTCACTCDDDSDPRYEDWVTDPDPEGIPEGAWD